MRERERERGERERERERQRETRFPERIMLSGWEAIFPLADGWCSAQHGSRVHRQWPEKVRGKGRRETGHQTGERETEKGKERERRHVRVKRRGLG